MTMFRKVLLGTGGVIAVLAIIGLLLPRYVHVERAINIDAPRPTVFTVLNSFTHFNKWSPWAHLDPNAKYSYEGPESGVGAKLAWVGDPATMGNGEQVIITSEPWGRVQTDFDFGPQGKATGTHILTIDGTVTRVVWGFNTDLGMNPVNRYFGLMFDKMIGADYERGLAGLKTLVESMPKADFSTLAVESAEAAPQTVLFTPLTTPCDDEAVAEGLAKSYAAIDAFIKANGLATVSAPISIRVKEAGPTCDLQPAIPIKKAPARMPDGSPLRLTKTYEGRVLKVTHTGPYRHLPVTYKKIAAYLVAHGVQQNGHAWDEWVDDPAAVPEAQLRTIIWVPIAQQGR